MTAPSSPASGVTGVNEELMVTRTQLPPLHGPVTVAPAMSMQAYVGRPEPGYQPALRGERRGRLTARAERAAGMDAGDARELAGRLGDAVELVHGAPEVDRPHHQQQEDRDGDRELDQALPAFAGAAGLRRATRCEFFNWSP